MLRADTHSGEDTELARLLYAAGRVPLDQLSPLLDTIRAQRAINPQASLAALLVNSGVVSERELEQLKFSRTDTIRVATGAPPSSGGFRAGGRVPGYTLEEVLGRGATGIVVRAKHMATGRQVAIKSLYFEDPEVVERFTREATAQAAVDDHPNVVRVYGAGTQNGRGYLAMELLTGGDLFQRIKRGEFASAREAAEIVAQLARGLAHVHAQGILHRDLKPENILFDAKGTPKLVDFGLARVDGARSLTDTGQLLGTPEYMAPEQALGLHEVDERTDVYGLGAILYVCLTGRPPFQGQLTEVLAQVLAEEPPRPSSLKPGLDPELEAICMCALAKRPEDRYQNARSFAEALEEWAATPEPVAPPQSSGAMLAAGVGALCLAAGLGLGLLLSWQPAPAPGVASTLPAAAAGAKPTPAAPASAGPTPAATETPAVEPPRQVANADLRPGSLVMVPVEGADPGAAPYSRLGWVTELEGDAFEPRLKFLVGGDTLGPIDAPKQGFRGDSLGVGALALIERSGRSKPVPCTVRRRRGPVALVEYADQDRQWVPVFALTLTGEGAAPGGGNSEAQLVLAPWPRDGRYYPAVVLDCDRGEKTRLRVAYLDEGTAWVANDSLRPLPEAGDSLRYTESGGTQHVATVAGYPGPWVVKVAHNNGTYSFVDPTRYSLSPDGDD